MDDLGRSAAGGEASFCKWGDNKEMMMRGGWSFRGRVANKEILGCGTVFLLCLLVLVLIGSVILRVLVGLWGVSGQWSWIGPTGTRTITLVVASGSCTRTSGRWIIIIIINVNIMIHWSSVSGCH